MQARNSGGDTGKQKEWFWAGIIITEYSLNMRGK